MPTVLDEDVARRVADALSMAALNIRDEEGLLIQPVVINPRVIYGIALGAVTAIAGCSVRCASDLPRPSLPLYKDR